MFRKLGKSVVYTVTAASTLYLVARRLVSIGHCQDISMEPAIKHGDWVIISPMYVDQRWLEKGDVVFSCAPKDPYSVICKRVKAFEGEKVFNNEKNTDELVGRGHVWLEGDYQEASIDSRSYGPVPYGLLGSKVVFRVWPLERLGPIPMIGENTFVSKESEPLSIVTRPDMMLLGEEKVQSPVTLEEATEKTAPVPLAVTNELKKEHTKPKS